MREKEFSGTCFNFQVHSVLSANDELLFFHAYVASFAFFPRSDFRATVWDSICVQCCGNSC